MNFNANSSEYEWYKIITTKEGNIFFVDKNSIKKEGDIVNSAEVIGEFDDTQEAQSQNKASNEQEATTYLIKLMQSEAWPKGLDSMKHL